MKNIDLSKNAIIWDGKSEGFYEAYYIQCNDPISGMAWWFRYSILIPEKGHGMPYAALWAVQFDQSGARGPVAMKHICPLNHFRYEKDRFILYIEDGFLTNSHGTGRISHGGRALEWDIQWVPSDKTFLHFPDYLYSGKFPKSKVVSPHWATTGGGFIRWNDSEFFLSDALIHVGHVWGRSHSNKWVWVHTHGFDEDETACFEGLWIPLCSSLGLSMSWFKHGDKVERFTDIGNSWDYNNFVSNGKWNVNVGNGNYKLKGKIDIDHAHVAGLTYHDPDGTHRYCYNSKVSSLTMDVKNKKSGEVTKLHAPNTTAFEIVLPEELNQFKMLV